MRSFFGASGCAVAFAAVFCLLGLAVRCGVLWLVENRAAAELIATTFCYILCGVGGLSAGGVMLDWIGGRGNYRRRDGQE